MLTVSMKELKELIQVYEARSSSSGRKRFLYLRVIIDYLKTNSHRIAHHVLSRTTTPLASRNDIKPLIPLINGEIADIFTLDPNSKKTFVKSVESEELVAHFPGDISLNDSLTHIHGDNIENIHFVFVTNGILTPELLQIDYTSQYPQLGQITFLETRFDPESIHKISNPSIYLPTPRQTRDWSLDRYHYHSMYISACLPFIYCKTI